MSSQVQIVKEALNTAIAKLCENTKMFVKNPSRDFTRDRKLPLREMISILLCMEGGSLTNELLRYFKCSKHTHHCMDTHPSCNGHEELKKGENA